MSIDYFNKYHNKHHVNWQQQDRQVNQKKGKHTAAKWLIMFLIQMEDNFFRWLDIK